MTIETYSYENIIFDINSDTKTFEYYIPTKFIEFLTIIWH